MDVFALRDRLIDEYRQYVSGFVTVKQQDVAEFVREYFAQGRLWPEPLVQLNPAFQAGRSIDELVTQQLLHKECATIFRRRDRSEDLGHPITLHQHQDDAITAAATGKSYVLTTGTGSGKSLAYFIPIVDHVLRHGPGQGIKAIVVYPMNALCNSQAEALDRFLQWGYPGRRGPVSFAKYTGQENETKRREIIAQPPDILLTNYVMLELILAREEEQQPVEASNGLEFLVLDELHTYRGRQGADVAMLVRRVRDRCGAPTMRCVGSATIAGQGTREERQAEVAKVATRLFGSVVPPDNVIGETLRRATVGEVPSPEKLRDGLSRVPDYQLTYSDLAAQPLAVWAETALGLKTEEKVRLERRSPRTISSAAAELHDLTGVAKSRCAEHLQKLLLAGCNATDPVSSFPLFAFRLHQFISRGDTIYAMEPPSQRYLSAEGQVYVPGDRERHLFPLAFCRACGQEYHVVELQNESQLVPRDLDERSENDSAVMGFVVLHSARSPRNPADKPCLAG